MPSLFGNKLVFHAPRRQTLAPRRLPAPKRLQLGFLPSRSPRRQTGNSSSRPQPLVKSRWQRSFDSCLPAVSQPQWVSLRGKRRAPRQSRRAGRRILLWSSVLMLLFVISVPRLRANSTGAQVRSSQTASEVAQRANRVKTLFRRSAEVTDVNQITPVERLRNAIIAQESNGNQHLINESGSGALGMGQVMPEVLVQWSKEIFGREVSQQEFLNRPDLQIKLMDYKLNQYWQEAIELANGDEEEAVMRVASIWYSGDPHQFRDTTPQYWADDLYPSIADYCNKILARFRN